MRTAFVTGSAGFIGFHLCKRLLADGFRVVGLDAMTDYYDVALKEARLAQLPPENFTQITGKVEDPGRVMEIFAIHKPDVVVHLAAQAGVRYSIDNPRAYL